MNTHLTVTVIDEIGNVVFESAVWFDGRVRETQQTQDGEELGLTVALAYEDTIEEEEVWES